MNGYPYTQELLTRYIANLRLSASADPVNFPNGGFCSPLCNGRTCRGCPVATTTGYGHAGQCNEEIPCPLCFPPPYVAAWCFHMDSYKRLLAISQALLLEVYGPNNSAAGPAPGGDLPQ